MKRTLFVSAIVLSVAVTLCFIWIGILMIRAKKPPARNQENTLVLVSIDPYAEMVRQIAGDTVEVSTIIPAHVDPHNYETTFKEMNNLKGARAWFTTGMGFEGPLKKKLIEMDPNLAIYDLNKNIVTLDSSCNHNHNHKHCEVIDTHTWLSPKVDVIQARYITSILSDLAPENKDFYIKNFKKLEEELDTLDAKMSTSLSPYHGDVIITTHGAYTYFCHEYHLEQLVIEPSEGKEPRVREITELIEQVRKKRERITCILTQPQHTNKAAKILARDLGMKTYSVDPYAANYMDTMKKITEIITESPTKGAPK